ncbi:MAG: hypothetical protein OEZ59_12445 [Deltaproteobacteria bacterium]|nr:hypothetical protein [Deltaproteobacteria bacterium]
MDIQKLSTEKNFRLKGVLVALLGTLVLLFAAPACSLEDEEEEIPGFQANTAGKAEVTAVPTITPSVYSIASPGPFTVTVPVDSDTQRVWVVLADESFPVLPNTYAYQAGFADGTAPEVSVSLTTVPGYTPTQGDSLYAVIITCSNITCDMTDILTGVNSDFSSFDFVYNTARGVYSKLDAANFANSYFTGEHGQAVIVEP